VILLLLFLAGTALAGPAQAQISTAGLELRLNLDGSGQTASDSSGNGNDCQLGSTTGSDADDPAWTSEGLQFDGGDFADCLRTSFGGTSLLAQGSESFTVQVVALQPTDATSRLLARSTGAETVFELGSQSGSGVAANLRGTSTTIQTPTPTNEWHLWTVRWNGSAATGRLDHGTDVNLGVGAVAESTENLAIGARSVSTGGVDFLPNGSKIAFVLLYDRALENSEMRRQYCAIREYAGTKSVDLPNANCPAAGAPISILSGTALLGVPQRVASPGQAPPAAAITTTDCASLAAAVRMAAGYPSTMFDDDDSQLGDACNLFDAQFPTRE
jgi:hypothetical protein